MQPGRGVEVLTLDYGVQTALCSRSEPESGSEHDVGDEKTSGFACAGRRRRRRLLLTSLVGRPTIKARQKPWRGGPPWIAEEEGGLGEGVLPQLPRGLVAKLQVSGGGRSGLSLPRCQSINSLDRLPGLFFFFLFEDMMSRSLCRRGWLAGWLTGSFISLLTAHRFTHVDVTLHCPLHQFVPINLERSATICSLPCD